MPVGSRRIGRHGPAPLQGHTILTMESYGLYLNIAPLASGAMAALCAAMVVAVAVVVVVLPMAVHPPAFRPSLSFRTTCDRRCCRGRCCHSEPPPGSARRTDVRGGEESCLCRQTDLTNLPLLSPLPWSLLPWLLSSTSPKRQRGYPWSLLLPAFVVPASGRQQQQRHPW